MNVNIFDKIIMNGLSVQFDNPKNDCYAKTSVIKKWFEHLVTEAE